MLKAMFKLMNAYKRWNTLAKIKMNRVYLTEEVEMKVRIV